VNSRAVVDEALRDGNNVGGIGDSPITPATLIDAIRRGLITLSGDDCASVRSARGMSPVHEAVLTPGTAIAATPEQPHEVAADGPVLCRILPRR
jgi:hypothetical protein